jgi:hypothetical protein
MFRKIYYKIWAFQSKLCSYFGGTPLVWNEKENKLIVTRRSKRYFYFYTTILYLTCAGYLGLRTLSIKLWGSMNDIGYVMALFQCGLFNCCVAAAYLPRPKEAATVINAVIRFGVDFNRKFFA